MFGIDKHGCFFYVTEIICKDDFYEGLVIGFYNGRNLYGKGCIRFMNDLKIFI